MNFFVGCRIPYTRRKVAYYFESYSKYMRLIMRLFYINAVKNLRNTANTNTLQDDDAGSMEMHCNPAIIIYKNTNIYKYKRIQTKEMITNTITNREVVTVTTPTSESEVYLVQKALIEQNKIVLNCE